MGAIADGIAAYAQPLIDQTDGSLEQVEQALQLTTVCFNLAILPEDTREEMICDMQDRLKMDDREFDDFRSSVIEPMVRRHKEMFPLMHRRAPKGPLFDEHLGAKAVEKYHNVDRYAPCPCNSGKKYKFCCGKRA